MFPLAFLPCTINVFSLVSAFQSAFYFKFCSATKKLKFNILRDDIRIRLHFVAQFELGFYRVGTTGRP